MKQTIQNQGGKTFEFIPPKAVKDQSVWVHNYNKKRKVNGQMVDANMWEWATVSSVKTGYTENENGVFVARHSYDVILDRRGGKHGDSALWLYLSEDKIQTETGH